MVKKYYIIGGGVSGLTLALELLRKGASVTIIESSDHVAVLLHLFTMKIMLLIMGLISFILLTQK